MQRHLLIGLHALLGVAAVAAGQVLVREPSGKQFSFEVEWLEGSPFADYRVPGLFLMVVVGTTNLASAVTLWRRDRVAPLGSLGTGVLLLIWIAMQTWLIGLRDWMQVMWMAVFALVTALAAREWRRD